MSILSSTNSGKLNAQLTTQMLLEHGYKVGANKIIDKEYYFSESINTSNLYYNEDKNYFRTVFVGKDGAVMLHLKLYKDLLLLERYFQLRKNGKNTTPVYQKIIKTLL